MSARLYNLRLCEDESTLPLSLRLTRLTHSYIVSYRYKLRHTRTLAVNSQGLSDVPAHIFKVASEEKVHVVDFARNQLSTLPKG